MFEETTVPIVIIALCVSLSIALVVYRRMRPGNESGSSTN